MIKREELEGWEDKRLAPYAVRSKQTRGRIHPEEEHPFRLCYQRDRDRIIHCTAFRRLEYKTQVFVNHEGDYYRTRLTHTLEVAQIATSIARALRLNEDLAEALSLAHDLGHTPFGHSGEDALRELMKDHSGFDHNTQGLRVVDYLEERYPQFKGLNLTWEVREGIVKHSTFFDKAAQIVELDPHLSAPLETQVVNIADEIAYDNHDLDDGLTGRLIKEEDLKQVELWREVSEGVEKDYPNLKDEIRKFQIVKSLINLQVTDLVEESEKRIERTEIRSLQDVRNAKGKIVSFSPQMSQKRLPLREFLIKNLYQHYRVVRMADKAHRFIRDLFKVYLNRPEQLPPTTYAKIKQDGLHRAICDYIAGMTDRYAQDEYNKLFEPYERV